MPEAAVVPGGVALVELGRAGATYASKPVMPLPQPQREGHWVAVVGIALAADVKQRRAVAVRSADGCTRLTVAPRHVALSPEDLARHERERVHLAAVLRTFTPRDPTTLRLQQEVGVVVRGHDDSHAVCVRCCAQTGVRHGTDCYAHAVILLSRRPVAG